MSIVARVLLVILLSLLGRSAMAAESICPGGASPRSDIKFCTDFENWTANCTTGLEILCFVDNGINRGVGGKGFGVYDWIILRNGGAAGTNYASARIPPGSVGTQILGTEPVPGFTYPPDDASPIEIGYRYYVRYTRGFASFFSGHGGGPHPAAVPNTGFAGAPRLQASTYSNLFYYAGGHSVLGGQAIEPNITRVPMLNNRWYLIEFYMKMDTSCVDVMSFTGGCNGILKLWIDGVKTHDYSNLNLGGVHDNLHFNWLTTLPGFYIHFGGFSWAPAVEYDQFAISDCTNSACTGAGPYIGAAAGATPGTGDPNSPYVHSGFSYQSWRGRHGAEDCTVNGYLGIYSAKQYRTAATLDSAITHGTYLDGCWVAVAWLNSGSYGGAPYVGTLERVYDGVNSSDCTVGGGSTVHYCAWNGSAWVATANTDNSAKITLSGDCLTGSCGGGAMNVEASGQFGLPPQWALHGWIYLPSSNNYSFSNLVLSGLTVNNDSLETNPSLQPSSYIGMTISGGNWAVKQVDAGGTATVGTSTPVTFDTWHEFEIIIWNDQTVSLMIDQTRLLTKAALTRSVAWIFPPNTAFRVIGVIDFKGTSPFVVHYDDNDALSASAWSCDGWGASSCPFGSPTTPKAPTAFTITQ